ncbi:hypothetical protein NGM10_07285 [Halorussus salilacus]|uniref:hypothetical protein n=1 Tax=Halorussus salilacus TaxID=2953750 RepID=UPI00209E12C7|nr:hypothetical protein [Halorussus salilacus]USZ69528.1 hypothetical protein NGM10_07285 [Halorussus salilacus]
MNRRGLLTRTGALLGIASLGGCLSRYTDDVPGDDEETESRPTLADDSFEMTDAGCGSETNEATVEFEDESVVVTGTIPGSNACHVARLADAGYDPASGLLELTVESVEDRGEDEACADCIAEIDYEATFEFEGGLPESVTVTHEAMDESTTVAEADPE